MIELLRTLPGGGVPGKDEMRSGGVYQDLPLPVREALHRDAATVLMDTGAPLLRVASQLAVSATPGDERAIMLLDRAVQELASDSAAAAADLAVRVLELVSPDDARRPDMVARAVRRLAWAGRVDEVLTLGEGYLGEHNLPPSAEAAIVLNVRMAWTNSWGLPYPRPMPAQLLSDPGVPAAIRANLIALQQMQKMGTRRSDEADSGFAEAVRLAAECQGKDGETAPVFWLWPQYRRVRAGPLAGKPTGEARSALGAPAPGRASTPDHQSALPQNRSSDALPRIGPVLAQPVRRRH